MASEVERIGEECRQYSQRMVERMAEARARREARSRELAEQSAAEMSRLREEMADRAAEQENPGEDWTGAEKRRQDNEQSHQVGQPGGPQSFRLRDSEIERLRAAELERQEMSHAPLTRAGGTPVPPGYGEGDQASAGQFDGLDPREAIARAAAARRRNSVVAPIDDDGDDESVYYRRNSWLV